MFSVQDVGDPLSHLTISMVVDRSVAVDVESTGGVGELVVGGLLFGFYFFRDGLGPAEGLDPGVHQQHRVCVALGRNLVETGLDKVLCRAGVAISGEVRRVTLNDGLEFD